MKSPCCHNFVQTKLFLYLLLWSITTFSVSCVQISLPKNDRVQNKNIYFNPPHSSFVAKKNSLSDYVWQSSQTNNVIAVYTECNMQSNLSLADLQNDALATLQKSQVLSEKTLDFNQREALRSSATGTAEGVRIQIEQVIVQKNSCNYLISLTGKEKSIQNDIIHFENFYKGIQIP